MHATLQSWSFARVLLASAAWILGWLLLSLAVVVGAFLLQLRSAGSAGVGAVSFGISEGLILVMLAVLLAPPATLIVSWLIIRRPATKGPR